MTIPPIIHLIQRQALQTPNNIALVYHSASYTYREVMLQAGSIARQLGQCGLSKEAVVGILIPRNQWMAMAPLGVLAAGCAYMPLDPTYPAERLNFMLSDSGAKLLIADREVLASSGLTVEGGCVMTKVGTVPVLYTDELEQLKTPAPPSPEENISAASLALLIYTSGSTGQPKGCMIEQRNITCNAEETRSTMGLDSDCRVASYASFSFVPTVHDIFGTLSAGATLYIIPEEVRFDFERLAQFINDNAITHIIMSTMTGRQFVTMYDCPSLRFLSVGGEKLEPVTPTAGLTFLNIYGSSEACGMITCHAVRGDEENIPIGQAPGTYCLYIVGEDGQPVADGEAGELWISGPQLCRGYLNHPELTANVFIPNPFNDKHEAGYERAFRTGDFVRRDAEGRLLFAGRRDGLVKVRGFRVELREVEAAVLTCPGVTGATLQSASDTLNGTYIVAYVTGEKTLDADAIRQHVAALKPEYMVPEVVMQLDEIPRNANGKVDRARLPKPARSEKRRGEGEAFVPENDLQRDLHELIATEIGSEAFGLNTPLLYAGMTSVTAIKVASLIHRKYGVSLNAQAITKDFSLRDIEEAVAGSGKPAAERPQPSAFSHPTSVPLSNPQIGVYIDCLNNPESTIYNIPMKAGLPLSCDTEVLAKAVTDIIKAHPALSVHFENDGTDTLQVTDPEQKVEIPVRTMSEAELASYKYAFVKPFDLEAGPVYRAEIVKTEKQVYLLTDFHHLVADGGSYDLFYRQLCSVLEGNAIDLEDLSYADYVTAEKEAVGGEDYAAAQAYFARRLDGVEGMTEIFPDLTNPSPEGVVAEVAAPLDFDAVNSFCRQYAPLGITPAHLALAGVYYTLSRFANSERVCMMTVSSGRSNVRIADTMGMFVNTLVLSSLIGAQKVIDFIRETSEDFRETLSHENYPFAQIVSDYGLTAEIMFAYQMGVINHYHCKDAELQLENLEQNNVPKFPLAIFVREHDGTPSVCLEYNNGRYSQGMMQSLADSICQAIAAFIREPESSLLSVSLVGGEQETLLDSFNQTDVDYDTTQTVVSLFRRQAKATPDAEAVVFEDHRYTYAQVDDISDRIAGYILSKGLGVGDAVSVIIPRCEWMAIASLGILKAGCAYQPLDPSYPKERLNFMMQDASAKLLIADEQLRDLADEYQGEVLLTKDIPQLSTANSQQPIANCLKPSDRFILLYTSGSTGVPKGCQLTHGNLVCFCHWYQRYYSLKPGHNVAAYASYGFDACMMDLYPALTCGASVYIIPEELRLDLIALNDYFEQNKITHSFMTTQVGYQFGTSIENHSLLHLSTGGEKLASLAPPTGYEFHNAYGPTECTIFTTTYTVDKKLKEIPIGKPLDNMRLYIVDQQGHRLPIGAAGELWISGPQVSLGYLNRPEKTAEVFIDNPFVTDDHKYSRCYRTGDIVRYLPSGDIQFVGRQDGQVKIRGFRIELKEVEAIIREFPGIKDATVQAFDEDGGGKFIAAYIVSDEQVDIEALNNFILDQKPPYMVPAVTMQIDAIPLNQNQKVNKRALPKPVLSVATESQQAVQAPLNVLEQEIHGIIAKIINTEDFGLTTVLGYVGLTSIMAIKLAIQINKRFGVALESKSLAKTGTLQSIENEILNHLLNAPATAAGATAAALPLGTGQVTDVPLSYAQIGVYVDCVKQPTSTVYNIPALIRFPKDTDVELLARSIETLINAHPQFKVHFDTRGSEIVQIMDPNQPVDIRQSRLSSAEMEKYKVDFVKPFNLRQGPLYRMEIVTTEQDICLLADVHHLIFDGGSLDVFMNQLCDLMNAREIEPEAFSYADFVADEKAAENSPSYQEAKDFFNERLGKVEGVTEVPSDLTNPMEQGTTSEVFCRMNFAAVEDFCKKNNLAPSHLTLAAVFYTLSRFTNNEQICITTISGGRSDLRISNTTGMFVNTLALSAQIDDQSVMDFLKETGKNFDDTLSHEKYPFSQIANDYDLSAEIMFAYQMGVIDHYIVNGKELEIESLELNTPKFRIAFYIQEKNGVPGVLVEYDNGRYSPQLMESMAQSVCNAVEAFIRQPEVALKSVSLLDAQQTTLLDSFNDTEVPYDDTQTVVSLFRRQVQLTPDNMAVVYHDNKYTYREADDLSERIASLLVGKGLGKEDVVSIIIPRCEWMPIAALGVMKAGCAYQPLDPSYPQERLNFMIKDAAAKLLIADESLRDLVSEYDGEVLLTKDIKQLPVASKPVDVTPDPADLYILLYTSGSTGLPKGCQLEHHNLAAFCHWYQRRFELKAEHHVSCYASYGFDCCMMDLYPALTCGACVYIIGDDIRLTLPEVNAYFEENHITHSFMTTQVAYQFATNYDNHSLLHLIAAGEKLASLAPPKNFKMHNGYGPTEGTILITEYEVDKELKDIPVGKPLDNSRLYIVDKQFNRLPLGALGELWISGPHVTRSYLNRPEKTAEVYINNPFSDDPKFSRIYRTGDIVRYQPDGNIQFVGRKDGQVKIRGFRIEMKEVEAVIRQYPGIKDATVQAFDYENGGKFIAAYIVSDESVDIKDLNAFIGKQKPPYMIPAATMQIDAIPLNQNQKVNRKALPAPVIQAADHEYVEPANDTEKLFCKIFSDVLSLDKIGATDNFFELGGTSLMVTKVIIEADKAGHHVAYGDVFPHPTPRLLAQFVTGEAPVEITDEEVTNFDYSGIDAILQRNTVDTFLKGERQPLGNVLLTGATGYLGIHVLRELIESDATTITCFVRGKDQAAAEHRLKNLLFYYFETSYKELFGSRLFVVNGDVTQDMTSILPEGHPAIDTVFNCAANVKHFSKGTDIEDVNIGGAQRCVEFCLKAGARLVHVSTTSVGDIWIDRGDGKQVPNLDERKLWFGQFLDNRYIHSKFLAERVVLDAVAHHGLSAKVMRVGNLAPRSYDGEFQVNFNSNSYMGRLKVFYTLGCCPYNSYDELTELSPIDETAKAVVLLASSPKDCTVFQPFNNHTELLGDVLRLMSKVGNEIRFVEADQFEQTIAVAGQDPEKAKLLSAMLAYQDMVHGQKAVFVERDNRYTCSVLHRLGFRWSDTSWDYVERMLTAIAGFGFFE